VAEIQATNRYMDTGIYEIKKMQLILNNLPTDYK